jgi:hypothetical protein
MWISGLNMVSCKASTKEHLSSFSSGEEAHDSKETSKKKSGASPKPSEVRISLKEG